MCYLHKCCRSRKRFCDCGMYVSLSGRTQQLLPTSILFYGFVNAFLFQCVFRMISNKYILLYKNNLINWKKMSMFLLQIRHFNPLIFEQIIENRHFLYVYLKSLSLCLQTYYKMRQNTSLAPMLSKKYLY